MKRKNKGFTLAEIIITLGIVAIAASLTLPDLIMGLRKNVMSSSLSRSVEQVEYAVQNIFDSVNEYNEEYDIASSADLLYPIVLSELVRDAGSNAFRSSFSPEGFDRTILEYFGCQATTEGGRHLAQLYKDYDGETVGGSYSAEVLAHLSHSNTYSFEKTKADLAAVNIVPANVNSPNSFVLFLCIDTNGVSEGPNRFGKDVFVFKLRNDGKVVPYGDAANCVKGNIRDGISCSARVVADGYKVEYD